uniref:Uncharacterized protein n=1 Tax=Grammatophora oceanica TaxID=210454 RepID=A0A7S1USX2_9STRA|mmetsp:Transcript_21362/g.31764  ORF Transcript_21362/g.31764 Transcript_21362/m.31764 type:complete len:212 (+) Transcript_21362:142-777(+)
MMRRRIAVFLSLLLLHLTGVAVAEEVMMAEATPQRDTAQLPAGEQQSNLRRRREQQQQQDGAVSRLDNNNNENPRSSSISERRQLPFQTIPNTECSQEEGKVALDILFKTDRNPHETTLYLMDPNVGWRDILWTGLNIGLQELTHGRCLWRDRCYLLVILDTGEDGLCCSNGLGGYLVHYDHDRVASGDASDFREVIIPLGPTEDCEAYIP